MSIPHANPGELVDVRPLGAALAATVTKTLLKTGAMASSPRIRVRGKTKAPSQRSSWAEVTLSISGQPMSIGIAS